MLYFLTRGFCSGMAQVLKLCEHSHMWVLVTDAKENANILWRNPVLLSTRNMFEFNICFLLLFVIDPNQKCGLLLCLRMGKVIRTKWTWRRNRRLVSGSTCIAVLYVAYKDLWSRPGVFRQSEIIVLNRRLHRKHPQTNKGRVEHVTMTSLFVFYQATAMETNVNQLYKDDSCQIHTSMIGCLKLEFRFWECQEVLDKAFVCQV